MERTGITAFGLISLACALPLQTSAQVRHEYREVHMGMPVRIVLYAPNDSAARHAARAAFQRMAELEADLSDYREHSELRRIEAGAATWVTIKPSTFTVLARALEIAQLTEGAFDPTVAPLVALWRTTRTTGRLPAPATLDSARALVSFRALTLDSARCAVRLERPRMRLDLGGIAKGFILDEARSVLQQAGITRVLLEAGGDIVVGAPPPNASGWRIDVPHADASIKARAANLSHAALATSGPTRQHVMIHGVRYSHVIDPRTGLGTTSRRLAYVIAASAMDADALATALTLLPADRSRALIQKLPGITASVVAI